MRLTRYNPAVPATSAFSPFEGLFRHSFAGFPALHSLFDLPGFTAFTPQSEASLAVDVYEDADHYHARFEVPGVKKEDAKVELKDRVLSVSVSRKTKTSEGESSYELSRALTVPEGIAEEKITAKLEDGLLTLTLPKEEARKPRVIELN